ncbi:MAG TPA: caspase family protein, partial [Allocoleopsis sp.]
MVRQTNTIYALLIGIDYYQPNRLYKNLRGAVRDINLVEAFLREMLKVPTERICKLTSVDKDDTVLLEARSTKEQEPTYKNIVNAFDKITGIAKPGEQIYIHYSGHGGNPPTVYPNLKQGIGQRDEGIVPMDIGNSPDGRYLRDVEITTLLKRMT